MKTAPKPNLNRNSSRAASPSKDSRRKKSSSGAKSETSPAWEEEGIFPEAKEDELELKANPRREKQELGGSITAYLNQIGRFPQLETEDELQCARIMERSAREILSALSGSSLWCWLVQEHLKAEKVTGEGAKRFEESVETMDSAIGLRDFADPALTASAEAQLADAREALKAAVEALKWERSAVLGLFGRIQNHCRALAERNKARESGEKQTDRTLEELQKESWLSEAELSDALAEAGRSLQAYRGAHGRLLQANLLLVFSRARKYANSALPLTDLIGEANLIAIRAADRYISAKNCRFSSYLVPYLAAEIPRAIRNLGREIRLPVHIHEKTRKMEEAEVELTRDLQRKPTDAEIALRLSCDERKIIELRTANYPLLSIYAPVSNGSDDSEGGCLADLISSPEPAEPLPGFDETGRIQLYQLAAMCLEGAPQNQRTVIELLHGPESLSVDLAAERLRLSPEKVKSLEKSALARISQIRAAADCPSLCPKNAQEPEFISQVRAASECLRRQFLAA